MNIFEENTGKWLFDKSYKDRGFLNDGYYKKIDRVVQKTDTTFDIYGDGFLLFTNGKSLPDYKDPVYTADTDKMDSYEFFDDYELRKYIKGIFFNILKQHIGKWLVVIYDGKPAILKKIDDIKIGDYDSFDIDGNFYDINFKRNKIKSITYNEAYSRHPLTIWKNERHRYSYHTDEELKEYLAKNGYSSDQIK